MEIIYVLPQISVKGNIIKQLKKKENVSMIAIKMILIYLNIIIFVIKIVQIILMLQQIIIIPV